MKKNHRPILLAALASLILGGRITGPGNASAAEMRTISVNFTGGGGGNHPVNTDAFKGQLIGCGYYAGLVSRALVWNPGGGDTKLWIAGNEETKPWRKDDTPAFFCDGDAVTFGPAGGGGGVNVSGTVKPASAAFEAGAAYALLPEAGTDAKLVVTGAFDVAGTVTNGVSSSIGGTVTLGAGGTLALAPGSDAEQTVSGKISGEGGLVKAGEGTAEITAAITSKGTIAVNGGKLTINNGNAGVTAITAAKDNPVFVGPGATLRFQGYGQGMLPWNAWLLCDGGRVELNGTNPFPGSNLPVFTLTNRATLVADCSTGGGHLHLKTVNLGGSDILIAGNVNAWANEGLTAVNMTVAGACGISYAPGAAQNMLRIRQGGEIDVAAGGSLLFAVKAGKDAFAKTGPGTLIATNGAAFLSALTVNKGALKLPQEAGTFEKAVTFADDAVIDVSARTNAFDWGAKLAVPGGYTVKVDVSGREVKVGEKLLTWTSPPEGNFQLIGANFSVTKADKALEVISVGTVLILR